MIRNGSLTYPAVNSSLGTWQPTNHALNTFLIAILATILAYQLAAILFDLLLGLKPPGQTTASDISILLLSEDYSLFTLLANLHLSPTLSRWKFHGFRSSSHHDCHHSHHHAHHHQQQQQQQHPHFLHIREDDNPKVQSLASPCLCFRPGSRLSTTTTLKLAILLAAAPLANLLAVFLTVESDRKLTFRDVGFGGVAFGLNQNFSKADAELSGEVCIEYSTALSDLEISAATFYYCASASHTINQVEPRGASVLRMSYGKDGGGKPTPKEAVVVEFELAPNLVRTAVHADLRDNEGRVWRVKTKLTDVEMVKQLFASGVQMFKDACQLANQTVLDESIYREDISDGGDAWEFEWEVKCTYGTETAKTLIENGLLRFTLVESDKLEVIPIDDEVEERDAGVQTRDAEGFVFVERRRSFMTVGVLGICVIVVVVVRVIVRAVTRNDVHLGIELVLKDTLRLQRCDSMLQNERQIDYSDRIYEGAVEVGTIGGSGGGAVGGGEVEGSSAITTVALTHSSESDNLNLRVDNLI